MHHCNAHLSRDVTTVMWNESGRENPAWVFTDGGKEIHQLNNSKPSLAFGHEVFGEGEYDGTFYVDDKPHHIVGNSCALPFNWNQFIILNVAMGGNMGGEIASDFVSDTMEIEYVRIYQ